MANRTVQFLGQGYGVSAAEITVTASGNTIFSGAVNTVDQPLPQLPNLGIELPTVLCTFEVDMSFSGKIPMTCVVSAGTLIFADIYANYSRIPNPVYTAEQIAILEDPSTTQATRVSIYTQVAVPPLSQPEIDILLDTGAAASEKAAILQAHNCTVIISSGADGYVSIDDTDARSNVSIDGIAQTPDRGELPGTWWWKINTGSTLAYQLDVDPAAGYGPQPTP
jgi:hypothetical protein